jgi:phosphohistidine swiveling domain-containing protein
MHAAGLPVPSSAVVTTAVYRRIARQRAVAEVLARCRRGEPVSTEEVDDCFTSATVEHDDRAAILALCHRLGPLSGEGLALRSSATVEDLGRSSFAGQYRSVLRVDPDDDDAVLTAVARVLASLWHPAPSAYRRHLGIDEAGAAMAVLVMPMVSAEQAGVAFSVDPGSTSGAARIEWVDGTAEDLVSGARRPSAQVVDRSAIAGASLGAGDLEPQLRSVLALALDAERVAGTPQDIEWAWDGERVWLVQARPITTVGPWWDEGIDDHVDPDLELTTAAIEEVLPGVIPPLAWSVASHVAEQSLRSLMDGLGALPAEPEGPVPIIRHVRGRAALAVAPISGLGRAMPGTAAGEVVDAFLGLSPGSPAGNRAGWRRIPWRALHDLRVLRIEARSTRSALVVVDAARRLSAERPDLDKLDDAGLVAYALRLVDLGVRTATAQTGAAAAAVAAHDRLVAALRGGLDPAAARRAAEAFVAQTGVTTVSAPDASAAYFAGPTWRELGREPPRAPDVGEHARTDPLDRLLAELPGLDDDEEAWLSGPLRLRRIERSAEAAANWLVLRERVRSALLTIGGEVRRTQLEVARRLADRGVLDDPGDVDLLTLSELHGVLVGGEPVDATALARRRRAFARARGGDPLPQLFRGVPGTTGADVAPGDRLVGVPLSPGSHRGPAVRVHDPGAALPRGAVLVAVATDPSWAPLFIDAGAIVVERGGTLSHTAILARELGVPAVSGVALASAHVDGLDVTVDGDTGTVVVHREHP